VSPTLPTRARGQAMASTGARPTSLAAFELSTISAGVLVADQVAKTAAVELLFAEPVSPGKFVVVFGGSVGEVNASYRRGAEVAGSALLDQLLLPQCHPDVFAALEGQSQGPAGDALGVIETDAVPATLLAADKAVKTAPVKLRVIRLANGLGGKGFIFLDGTVSDVNAAVTAARGVAGPRLVDATVIARLAEAVRDRLY
jgi:microcompartment protein CcmL/EutN